MDQITIPRSVVAQFHVLGIAPTDVLRQARLPQTLFAQERILVSPAQWFALWHAIEEINRDPALGLKLPFVLDGIPYDPLLITALSAPSFHAALAKVARYKRLFSFEDIRVVNQGSRWGIEAVWLASEEPAPALLIDVAFAHILDVGRRGTGRTLYPEQVLFRRAEHHRAMYEAYFQCPVAFGAEHNMLLLSDDVLMQPFTTFNPDLLALLEPQLETALRDHGAQQQFVAHVTTLLRSRIAGQQPTAQEVARELHMSTRTLQRRLAEEGMQFQHLLDTVRHEAAKQYLHGSTLALNEIAFLLGYQAASSFHRAFSQWEGVSPAQWRATRHGASGAQHTSGSIGSKQ